MTFIWKVIVQALCKCLIVISLCRVLVQQGSILFLSMVLSFLPRCPLAALASLKAPLYNGITTYTSWTKHGEALIPH